MSATSSLQAPGDVDGVGRTDTAGLPGPVRWLASGWVPAVLAGVFTAAVLVRFGVRVEDLLRYAAYLLLGIAIPGALWWRAAHGRSAALVEDLSAGACVGLALEVLTYIGARAVGVPVLVLVWPLATLVVFAAVPSLRRFWRGAGPTERPPVLWAWAMSGMVAFLSIWSAWTYYATHSASGDQSPYQDVPFHLALAAELKHHVPPSVPYVQGERLNYHWFVHAEAAATSHLTGIELHTLMYRLLALAPAAITIVLLAIAARRLTGRWWPGPLAAGVFLFALTPNPYPWAPAAVADASPLITLWTSPTQTFGLALFGGALLLLIDLLRASADGRDDGGSATAPMRWWWSWPLFAVLVAAVMGSKATVVPMLIAGLVLALIGQVVGKWPTRPLLVALGIALPALVFAQLVLFGGTSGALSFEPFVNAPRLGAATGTGLTVGSISPSVMVALFTLGLLLWAYTWAGALGLALRRRLFEPAILVLIGLSAAGTALMLSLQQSGASQVYFFRSAGPSLALLAATGLAALVPAGRRAAAGVLAVAAGLALGMAAIVLVRAAVDTTRPTVTADGRSGVLMELWLPSVALLAALALVALALLALRQRLAWLRGVSAAMVLAMAMGFALPPMVRWFRSEAEIPRAAAPRPWLDGRPEILADGVTAARWLRDHSSPDDLVATNGHCRPISWATCDNRHFWISAYAERRVLVEGWGYTDTSNKLAKAASISHAYQLYWDRDRLAANDAAFLTPSAATVDRLRRDYGVRWLFVENRLGPAPAPSAGRAPAPSAELARYATLRFQMGDFAVYEI